MPPIALTSATDCSIIAEAVRQVRRLRIATSSPYPDVPAPGCATVSAVAARSIAAASAVATSAADALRNGYERRDVHRAIARLGVNPGVAAVADAAIAAISTGNAAVAVAPGPAFTGRADMNDRYGDQAWSKVAVRGSDRRPAAGSVAAGATSAYAKTGRAAVAVRLDDGGCFDSVDADADVAIPGKDMRAILSASRDEQCASASAIAGVKPVPAVTRDAKVGGACDGRVAAVVEDFRSLAEAVAANSGQTVGAAAIAFAERVEVACNRDRATGVVYDTLKPPVPLPPDPLTDRPLLPP